MQLGSLFLSIVGRHAKHRAGSDAGKRRLLQRSGSSQQSKLLKFASAQQTTLQTIRAKMQHSDQETIWIHAASMGEYAVARPIIKQLRSSNCQIVLTLFSPSAFQVLEERGEGEDNAHFVFALPWDTQANARQFLDIVSPDKAIFIISEYWINYLRELGRRQIPTSFVSCLIPDSSYLLRWYAKPIRDAIPKSTCFTVLDETSKANLTRMGFSNVTVTGDPLFDNALHIADMAYTNQVIECFCSTAEDGVLVAGSISDKRDLDIVCSFANTHRQVKCIFVPHETGDEMLLATKRSLDGRSALYSECTPETDFSKLQVLIIDFVGALARIYRYGRWAYVGGGFTPYLHSVIEPVVYGLPVAFGPCIDRKVTPQQMIDLGIGKMVTSAGEFSSWFDHLYADEEEMARISHTALEYARSNGGATKRVVEIVHNSQCRVHS